MEEKMKIGIITIHYGFNYGSVLQTYALFKYLCESTDTDVEVVNYIPGRYSIKRRYFTSSKNFNFIKKILYLILVAPQRLHNDKIFNGFLKKNVNLSQIVHNSNQANQVFQDIDCLITGSDQVWNSDYNEGVDPMYYLDFGKAGVSRNSYAASCGKDSYTEQEWGKILNYLRQFDNISLRELQSCDMFLKRGISKTTLVLDPVFLLNVSTWRNLEIRPHRHMEKYVLIYCLDSVEKDLIRIAKEVAREKGLKIAIISYCHIWNRYEVDYTFRNRTPNEFLWLVDNADYIVTNSFHGVSFSIKFNKQFLAIRREKYNNRLDSILNIFGLTERYIDYDADFDNRPDIDYSNKSGLMERWVDQSETFLRNVVSDCRNRMDKSITKEKTDIK